MVDGQNKMSALPVSDHDSTWSAGTACFSVGDTTPLLSVDWCELFLLLLLFVVVVVVVVVTPLQSFEDDDDVSSEMFIPK